MNTDGKSDKIDLSKKRGLEPMLEKYRAWALDQLKKQFEGTDFEVVDTPLSAIASMRDYTPAEGDECQRGQRLRLLEGLTDAHRPRSRHG